MFKNKINNIIGICATVLALILMVSALAYLSNGFRDWNAKKWFNSDNTDSVIVVDDGGNTLSNTVVYPLSRSMTFLDIEPAASSLPTSVSVKVNPYPAYAVGAKIDWKVSWASTSNSWVNGKTVTNYVTAVPTTDGAYTATITYKTVFNVQIKLTASVRNWAEVFAECLIDCVAAPADLFFTAEIWKVVTETNKEKLANFGTTTSSAILERYLNANTLRNFDSIVAYGNGSIKDVETEIIYTIRGNDTLMNRINANFGRSNVVSQKYNVNEVVYFYDWFYLYGFDFASDYAVFDAFANFLYANYDVPCFTINIEVKSDYFTFNKTISVYLSQDFYNIPSNLEFNNGNILVGG